MTHAEKRRTARELKCAAGDPRALLLASTEPLKRSEAAARYDHAIEATELDVDRAPSQDEIDRLRIELWRGAVAIYLAEHSTYHRSVERYIGGHRLSEGMRLEVARAEAATPFPSFEEAVAAFAEARRLRREYIRQRYGV